MHKYNDGKLRRIVAGGACARFGHVVAGGGLRPWLQVPLPCELLHDNSGGVRAVAGADTYRTVLVRGFLSWATYAFPLLLCTQPLPYSTVQ